MESFSVCILASQYFGWGSCGGFGSMARRLAEALVPRVNQVHVIVPSRGGQPDELVQNQVHLHAFSPVRLDRMIRLIRQCQVQLFHSQEPNLLTWFAQRLRPDARHLVTCRDPRDIKDWTIEFRDATWSRRIKTPLNYLTESGFLVRRAVQKAHGVYAPAQFLRPKIQTLFHLKQMPELLPNLIHVPEKEPIKSPQPSLLFVGRLDRRKRPELFFQLAAAFPEVRCLVVGAAEDDAQEQRLRQAYGQLNNVAWLGFLNQFEHPEKMADTFGQAWALVNTSSREGLPLSFQEAAAHGCAIVSGLDPDGYASRFGRFIPDLDFETHIREFLLHPSQVFAAGQRARQEVKAMCKLATAVERHLQTYRYHLGGEAGSPGDLERD